MVQYSILTSTCGPILADILRQISCASLKKSCSHETTGYLWKILNQEYGVIFQNHPICKTSYEEYCVLRNTGCSNGIFKCSNVFYVLTLSTQIFIYIKAPCNFCIMETMVNILPYLSTRLFVIEICDELHYLPQQNVYQNIVERILHVLT